MTNNNASALPTPSDLDECAAMTVADALKIILANSYAIYLKTKNFHWHVSGPYFRDYHLLLDEQAAEILAVTDAIAERARKTGNTTIRSIGDIARHQTIKEGSPQNSEKSYAKVFRASVRAETSRLPVCGSAARRNRRLG